MKFWLKNLLYLTVALSLALTACGLFDQAEEKAVVTVGKRKVSVQELKNDIKHLTAGMGLTDQGLREVIDPLLSRILDHYLVLEYGRQKGITVSDKELGAAVNDIKKDYPEEAVFQEMLLHRYVDYETWKKRLREQLLIKKIIDKVSEGVTPVTFDEIRAYFDAHRKEFAHPQMVKFSQIVTRSKHEAEQILERLNRGDDMKELARVYSVTPEAENAGEVGWVSKGQLDESIEKVIFSLPVGKLSQVVKTPYGYHIFKVQSRRSEGVESLAEAMPVIQSKLFFQKQQSFYRQWLEQLRELYPVQVDEEVLATLEFG